jgi:hypothetical protein
MKWQILTAKDVVDSLVNQTFPTPGGIATISLAIGDNEYFGQWFQVVANTTLWRPDRGSYNGLHGYWIFRPDARMCWQAVNANGPLRYWNQDGQAQGNPEDWELFVFEAVDASKGQVRIKNIYGAYVNYVGGVFQCTGNQGQAQVFTVVNQ